VDELDGDRRPLKVPSGELKLGGFEVADGGPQIFVIEFPLNRAMVYNPGPRRYILKPRSIRIVGVEEASLIAGTVAPELFTTGDCSSKPDELAGNVVYLYRGHDLGVGRLGDLFDPEIDEDAAVDLIEPYTSETVAADGRYLIAYLPAGMYTIAFACNAADDDSEYDDGIEIPDPKSEWAEIDLAPGDERECDFPVASGGCT